MRADHVVLPAISHVQQFRGRTAQRRGRAAEDRRIRLAAAGNGGGDDGAEVGVAEVGERHQQRQQRCEARNGQRADGDGKTRGARLAQRQVGDQVGHHHQADERQAEHGSAHLLRGYRVIGGLAFLHGHGWTELWIDEAAGERIGEIAAGEHEARTERRRIEQIDGDAHDRTHHHQHDAGRDQNAERAAGGNRTG